MKIAVVGLGYVGLSNAVLLAQHNEVVAVDVSKERVDKVNKKESPFRDKELEEYLATKELNLRATLDGKVAYENSDFIVIATPTDYDPEKNFFDTSSIETVLDEIKVTNSNAVIVIKSTIPVGYILKIREKYGMDNIMFAPEFLREGKALYDNLYPSRIVIGDDTPMAHQFVKLLCEGAIKEDIPVLFIKPTEAEAIKLFANTYLALRVAYFNELDTFAEVRGLDTKQIIDGVSLDPRIGAHYNNPSFGYGGYCLPKDTKQLLANYENVPNNLISAIITSNQTRKEHVADVILQKKSKVVGVYRLTMKTGSDNYRQAAIFDIIEKLKERAGEIVIYEPTLGMDEYDGMRVVDSLEEFKKLSDVILANRMSDSLQDVEAKVYTRDIYGRE